MRTACFLTVRSSVATKCQYYGGGGLSSDVQWTSLNRSAVTALAGVQGLVRSHVWRGPCLGGPVQWGPMYCGHGHMGTFPFPLYPLSPALNRMTETIENITFPQLHWRAVITGVHGKIRYVPQHFKNLGWVHFFLNNLQMTTLRNICT